MKINNLVQWFLEKILRIEPEFVEPRVFPSLIEGNYALSKENDFDSLWENHDQDWVADEELIPAKIAKRAKSTKKTGNNKSKSVKSKKGSPQKSTKKKKKTVD